MSRAIDVMHLGRDRVICAFERDGLVIDPGPSSSVAALDGIEPRAVLLTHIHLDHAAATGTLVERFPDVPVYVHERGAPHMVDPSRLLRSAGQLYADEMDRLWGEVLPVPAKNIRVLTGGETVEGLRVAYTPGHASHHVSYFDEDSGEAFVGDAAGVRIPPAGLILPPTPPPDIDVELWQESIDIIAEWRPSSLCLTHFGAFEDVEDHLATLREQLETHSRTARDGDRYSFLSLVQSEIAIAGDVETAQRYRQASPLDHLWLGLERYWRKRHEREGEAA